MITMIKKSLGDFMYSHSQKIHKNKIFTVYVHFYTFIDICIYNILNKFMKYTHDIYNLHTFIHVFIYIWHWKKPTNYSIENKIENKFHLQRFENEAQMEPTKFGKLLPTPKMNLCFENGRVGYWNKPKWYI